VIPWAFAARWAVDLLGGLAVIHQSGFVHQDVKPENVMIQGPDPGPATRPEATAAKLLDFGAVRSLSLGDVAGAGRVFVGTPEYGAPEQWAAAVVPASDLYTLGGTLYYAFTGRCPYQMDRRDAYAYRKAHIHEPVPDARDLNPNLPPPVSLLVRRMMAKNPDERGTAAELAAEFRHLLHRGGVTPASRLAPVPPRKPGGTGADSPEARRFAVTKGGEVRSPVRRTDRSLLGFLERVFIPGHIPPPPGEEPRLAERLLALLRRPPVILILAAVVFLLIYWMR
jgi:serine/threonine protein kinase